MADKKVIVELGVKDSSGNAADKYARKLESSFERTGRAAKSASKDMSAAEAAAAKLGRGGETGAKGLSAVEAALLRVGAAAGIAAAAYQVLQTATEILTGAVKTHTEYEHSMSNVAAVMGATVKELDRLKSAARDQAKVSVFSAKQVADAYYSLASAGMGVEEAISAANGVLALAAATQSDLAFTSKTVVSTLAQFKLAASDSERVANVFAAAISGSQANMESLADSMRYVGPVAKGLGQDLELTTAQLMALYNAGLSGEQAGTGLRAAMLKLQDVTPKAAETIKGLGVRITDAQGRALPFMDIMTALGKANMSVADATKIFGTEAATVAVTLAQSAGQIQKYNEAITGTNKAHEAVQTQTNDLKGDLQKLDSAAEELAHVFGDEVDPALRKFVQRQTEIAQDQKSEEVIRGIGRAAAWLVEKLQWIEEHSAPALLALIPGLAGAVQLFQELGKDPPPIDKWREYYKVLDQVTKLEDQAGRQKISVGGVSKSLAADIDAARQEMDALLDDLAAGWAAGWGDASAAAQKEVDTTADAVAAARQVLMDRLADLRKTDYQREMDKLRDELAANIAATHDKLLAEQIFQAEKAALDKKYGGDRLKAEAKAADEIIKIRREVADEILALGQQALNEEAKIDAKRLKDWEGLQRELKEAQAGGLDAQLADLQNWYQHALELNQIYGAGLTAQITDLYQHRVQKALDDHAKANRSTLDKMLDQWADHDKNVEALTQSMFQNIQNTWGGWWEDLLLGEFADAEDAISELGDAFVKMLAQMTAAWVANETLAGMANFFKDLKTGMSGGGWNFNSMGGWWKGLWGGIEGSQEAAAQATTTAAGNMDRAATRHDTAAGKLVQAGTDLSAAAAKLGAAGAVPGGTSATPGGLVQTPLTEGGTTSGVIFGWDPSWGEQDWSGWGDEFTGGTETPTGNAGEVISAGQNPFDTYSPAQVFALLTSAYALIEGINGLGDPNRNKFGAGLQALGGGAGLYSNQILRDLFGLGGISPAGQVAMGGLGVLGAGYGLWNNLQGFGDQGVTGLNVLSTALNAYNLYAGSRNLIAGIQSLADLPSIGGAPDIFTQFWRWGKSGWDAAFGPSVTAPTPTTTPTTVVPAFNPSDPYAGWGGEFTGGTEAGWGQIGNAGAGMAGGIAGSYASGELIRNTVAKERPNAMYGAMGGAAGGGAYGASVGTAILPGIGTLIGAALGAFMGGVVGGLTGGAFGSDEKPDPYQRMTNIKHSYDSWQRQTQISQENPEWYQTAGLPSYSASRYSAYEEIDKSVESGTLSQSLREIAEGTPEGAVNIKKILESVTPLEMAMGGATEKYHDFNVQVKDAVESYARVALEFDGYAGSGEHLSEMMGELADGLGLTDEQTAALNENVAASITDWQQFGGSTDELTMKIRDDFGQALIGAAEAEAGDEEATNRLTEAKQRLIAELDQIIAARTLGQDSGDAEKSLYVQLAEAIQVTGGVGQLAAASLQELNTQFADGTLTQEEYTKAQEDILAHLVEYNALVQDETRRTTEAATAEELLVAGMRNAAIVAEIQRQAFEQNGQAMSLVDAQTQALTGTIETLLTANSLEAIEQREMVNLLLFQAGRTEELTEKYKRYQEIKEALTKAHTMERSEVEKLVVEGRELAKELGFTKEATEGQTDANNNATGPTDTLAKAVAGVAEAVEALKGWLEGLPASGTTWDWYMNGHFNFEGEKPPKKEHSGGLIMHSGGFVGWPRLHGGGLAPDEVPIIAQKGEYMIKRSDVSALGGAAGVEHMLDSALGAATASTSTTAVATAADQTEEEAQRLADAYEAAIKEMQGWDAAWLRERYTAEQQAGDQLIQQRNSQMEQVKAWEEEGTITHEEAVARMGLIDQQWAADVVKLREEVTKAFDQTIADFWEGQKSQAEQAHDAIMQQSQDLLDELQRQYESGAIGSWEEYQSRRIDVEAMTDKALANLRSDAYKSLQAIVDNSLKGELSATEQQVQTLNDTYRDHLQELEDYYRAGTISQQDAQQWRLALQESYQRDLGQITTEGLANLENIETSALGQRKDRQEQLMSELLATEGLTQEGIQQRIKELMGVNEDVAGLEKDQKVLGSLQKWLTSPFTNATEAAALVAQARDLYAGLDFQTLSQEGGLAGSAVGVIGDREFLQGWTVSDPITDPGPSPSWDNSKPMPGRGPLLPSPIAPIPGTGGTYAAQERQAAPQQTQVVINIGQVGQLADAVIEASVKEFRTFLYQEQARQAQTGGPKPYTTSISRPALLPGSK
ncbi:MAG: phage tail tape measure protein [Deltaproteobacteria bacterium]|nr:phage tail tape measure protein [Deltaproteobacteria bacterium]